MIAERIEFNRVVCRTMLDPDAITINIFLPLKFRKSGKLGTVWLNG